MSARRKKYYIRKDRVALFLIVFFIGIFGCVRFVSAVTNMNSSVDVPDTVNVTAEDSVNDDIVVTSQSIEHDAVDEVIDVFVPLIEYPVMAEGTKLFAEGSLDCDFAILVDTHSNTVLAQKNGFERIYPASLTKIMTLIVAVENIENMNASFTMTAQILSPLYRANATLAGFVEGESASMIDLLYGVALPSGADATCALAEHICGSEEAFVQLMNEKAQQLSLQDTHFVNTSGLFDKDHYSTPADIAVILEYAIKNDLCREILSTYQYTTQSTPQHPEGILLTSTMFNRMYGTEVEGVLIKGGKTGFTNEAGYCLASFAEKDGREYVAVTTKGHGRYQPIYDCFKIYDEYID